jgi:hypothetical protein
MKTDMTDRSNSGNIKEETLNSLLLQFANRSHKLIQIFTVKLMASMFDRRIGLDRGGEIQYLVTGYALRFLCEFSPRLHLCKA